MTQRFESEEVDDATLEYLRTVRRHKGEGLPGVYLDAKAASLPTAWMPAAGAGIGLLLIVVTLFITVGATDDPINVAMLQTAGLFLGVWMVVAWMRDLAARNRPDYLGHFKFVDPLYLWHAAGRGVWATPLTDLQDASSEHKYDDKGNYTGSQVTLRLGRNTVVVSARPEYLAERLEAFLGLLQENTGGLPVQRGYDALDELNEREAEEYEDARDPPAPVHRLIDAIPEPHKVRSVWTWWRYPLIVGLFIATFLCSWKLCGALRDDAIFNIVQNLKPPELRAYLIDPRNKRHRAVVLQRLAAFHDQAAQQIESRRTADPQLAAGMASLVRAVGQDAQPVITIHFQRVRLEGPQSATMDRGFVEELTKYLTPLVGPEITAFGEVENAPAMMEIVCSPAPVAAGRFGLVMDWTVTLQAAPEAAKFVWKTQTESVPGAGDNIATRQQQYKEFKARFERALPGR